MMEAAKELAGPAWKGDNRILYYDEEQWEDWSCGDVVGQGEAEQSSRAVAQGSGAQADGQDLPSVQSEQSAPQGTSNVQGGPAPIGTAAAGSSKAAHDTTLTSLVGEAAANQAGQQAEHQQGSPAAYDARGVMGVDEEGQEQMTVAAPSLSAAGGLKRKREEVSGNGPTYLWAFSPRNGEVLVGVCTQHLPFSGAIIL
jgi:hypothetical protein